MSAWKVSVEYILFINTIIIGKCAAHLWYTQSYISFGDKFPRDYKWLVHGHTTMKRYHSNLGVLIPSPVVFIPLPSAFGLSAKGMQRINNNNKKNISGEKTWKAPWKRQALRVLKEGTGEGILEKESMLNITNQGVGGWLAWHDVWTLKICETQGMTGKEGPY